MTDLVRRALLGDAEAQKECTAQGILLTCPFCRKETTKIRGYIGLTFYKCRTCGATVSFDLPKYNKGLANTDAAWNTRAKPPVGECGTCSKYMTRECPMCSFDIDGACTGGPETGFYCALYGMEADDGK